MSRSTARHALAVGLITFGLMSGAYGQCDPREDQKVLPSEATSNFGRVATDGQTAVVSTSQASAWIFRKDGNGDWIQVQELTPSDGSSSFGSDVAVNGQTAFIGAHADDDQRGDSGAVYVFREDGQGTWVETQKLYGSGSFVERFGWSITFDQGTLVVGAPQEWLDNNTLYVGAVYVFEEDGDGQWAESARLLASDPSPSANLGWSVDISGDTILSGAHYDFHNGNVWDGGSAYIFSRSGSNWSQTEKLIPGDIEEGDQFGEAVALSGGSAFILSDRDDDNGTNTGSLYVFGDDGAGNWVESDKFLSPDGPGHTIGTSVSVVGDRALLGAPWGQVNGQYAGAVHLFREETVGSWGVIGRITASDAALHDYFGSSVLISGDTALIGAPGDDNANGDNAGAVYSFDLSCGCPADITGDGLVNTQDFIAFLNAWAGGDPVADWNEDGTINTQDFIAYLNDWAAGC